MQGTFFETYFDTVVASASFHSVVCCGSSITAADSKAGQPDQEGQLCPGMPP